MMNALYYGDNLDVLRRKIRDESIDFCYIDPPFNSKRNYNQIYNRIGDEDRAQAQAFVDTWGWNDHANQGYTEILANSKGRFQPKLVELIKGLHGVLGRGSLMAYLISISLRVTEIYRSLKIDGSFMIHCDPTASHYLKIILDSIFCGSGGEFLNEIVWCYNVGGKGKRHFARKHDILLWFSKSSEYFFEGTLAGLKRDTGTKSFGGIIGTDEDGRRYQDKLVKSSGKYYRYYLDDPKIPEDWWVDINSIQSQSAERLGYPTQKPEALMQRILKTCTRESSTVLDAYCGCGTTISVAQSLKRNWIGMDITYQSIALILKRIEDRFGKEISESVMLDGVPRDMASATALAHKKDDRLRKEFEKWAILTYSKNQARINEKKGADAGIDGVAFFLIDKDANGKAIFQVKSGGANRATMATLNSDRQREGAEFGILITMDAPTKSMRDEVAAAGKYRHPMMNRDDDRLQVVTIEDILAGKRLNLPMGRTDAVKSAMPLSSDADQETLF